MRSNNNGQHSHTSATVDAFKSLDTYGALKSLLRATGTVLWNGKRIDMKSASQKARLQADKLQNALDTEEENPHDRALSLELSELLQTYLTLLQESPVRQNVEVEQPSISRRILKSINQLLRFKASY